jgi:hypothetical protein
LKAKLPRVMIEGSAIDQQKWKIILAEKKISLSESLPDAEEILFCEGPDKTWKSVISEIMQKGTRFFYKFHGNGTHAAVGSHSSQEQGRVYKT